MKHRLFDGFLVLAIVSGGILAWQTGRERSRLQGDFDRLFRVTGELPVADPTQLYVLALGSRDPMDHVWRIYLPANYRENLHHSLMGMRGSSSGWSSSSHEFIARVRFREDENGVLGVFIKFAQGSFRSSVGDPRLLKLLRGRWDQLVVEQLGAPRLATASPDRRVVLLRMKLSDSMQKEAREIFSPAEQANFVPVLFELELRPDPTKP